MHFPILDLFNSILEIHSTVEPSCCRAMTADCLACAAGLSVPEYCANNIETVGCEGKSHTM